MLTVSSSATLVHFEFLPKPTDDAWWAGFQLGLDGVPAAPPAEMTDSEQESFSRGHDIGHARFVEDCERDFQEAMEREDWAFGDPFALLNEAEIDRAYGHRASEMMTGGAL